MRIVGWFSCGAASATAIKIALENWRKDGCNGEFVIAYCYIEDEHEDSLRFLKDCEKWFNHPITILKNEKYKASVNEVIKQTRYMSGVRGARCTLELKKQVRFDFQKPNDVHVFGFDVNEKHRLNRLIDAENGLIFQAPLIENNLSKGYCFNHLFEQGITLPKMYELGYNNNNCIGCVKSTGAGYWNKIRIDFPRVFATRSLQESLLNTALCLINVNVLKKKWPEHYEKMKKDADKGLVKWSLKPNGQLRVPLKYLPENSGNHKDLELPSCGFICELED